MRIRMLNPDHFASQFLDASIAPFHIEESETRVDPAILAFLLGMNNVHDQGVADFPGAIFLDQNL